MLDIAEISNFQASSFEDPKFHPSNAPFKNEHLWIPKDSDTKLYIEATFPYECIISGITTRGRGGATNHFIRLYKLFYLDKEQNWNEIGMFKGNSDRFTVSRTDFNPIIAFGLKLLILDYNEKPALNLAIHGYRHLSNPF